MNSFVIVGRRLRLFSKLLGISGTITTSYVAIQYQKNVGVNTDATMEENYINVMKWVRWKWREKRALSEDYLAKCCRWLSLTPLFHYIDLTSFLIYLANNENIFVHNLFVKLLAAVQFPEDAAMKGYVDMCSPSVLIGLARSEGVNHRWFQGLDDNPSPSCIDLENLGEKVDNLLDEIKTIVDDASDDPCCLWLVKSVLAHCLPPDPVLNTMVDLSEPDDMTFSSEGEMLFVENVSTYLEVLQRYSKMKAVSMSPRICAKFVDVIKDICAAYPNDKNILSTCGNMLANLALEMQSSRSIVELGLLDLMMKWRGSDFVSLQLTALRTLNNLDRCDGNYTCLEEGIYVLHPENRCNKNLDVDIIFIHGIKGSPFYTWRQTASVMDSYTYCWPKDWLPADHPSSRVISVGYKSTISDWLLSCPQSKDEYSLDRQARNICTKLKKCGVGGRPIIWVTHSMGGLLVKKILVALDNEEIANSTEGVVFYSTPHLGSPIATHSEKASYILFPSIEVNELSENSPKLKELHKEFYGLSKAKKIECVDFGETQPLSLPYIMLKSLVVPRTSSDVGYGCYLATNADHQNICKPFSKDDERYSKVKQMVDNVIEKHFPFKVEK